jgi:Xaa-Pro aminopeptidase
MTLTSYLIEGRPIPAEPDLVRMRRERHERLRAHLAAAGVDGLVLLGPSAVAYATGAAIPAEDASHSALLHRAVAVVAAGSDAPHLFTPFPEGAPPELPSSHLHPPLFPDFDDGVKAGAELLVDLFPSGSRLACDELTHALRRQLPDREFTSAAPVLGGAKLVKTPDELACIRGAQRLNELAMGDVLPALRPGVSQNQLTAVFLQRVFELGATGNAIDPIWQVMPTSLAEGPWTTHGGIAFPTPSGGRLLRHGDVVWVDSGVTWHGYASDFGRTWIVGDRLDRRQRAQYGRWRSVVDAVLSRCKPGATALELGQAAIEANGGTKPWIDHFYLAHGVGTDSAEMPLIGTDLGEAFDSRLVLQPGMVLVLEPVIWDDGAAGYRSEDMVAVTDDGWVALSDFPYDPFS